MIYCIYKVSQLSKLNLFKVRYIKKEHLQLIVLNVLVALISKSHAGANRNEEAEDLKDD